MEEIYTQLLKGAVRSCHLNFNSLAKIMLNYQISILTSRHRIKAANLCVRRVLVCSTMILIGVASISANVWKTTPNSNKKNSKAFTRLWWRLAVNLMKAVDKQIKVILKSKLQNCKILLFKRKGNKGTTKITFLIKLAWKVLTMFQTKNNALSTFLISTWGKIQFKFCLLIF